MPAALAAAHVGHQIEHSSALFGFIAGAVVGLAIGIAVVAATVATGGAALAVIAAVGGAVAATGGMALAGKYIGEAIKSPHGPITMGSTNVLLGPARMPAARATVDPIACISHKATVAATGSDSVFVNQLPAVRRTDKTACGAEIGSDLDHIFIGAETAQYMPIQSEVPEWAVNLAQGMVIVGTAVALVFGAAAAVAAGGVCGLISFGGTTLGGMAGGFLGGELGGVIGEAIGGELGRRIGEVTGGLVGGLFGARVGNRMATGHPVDVATGELFTSETDFILPGLVPVVWERFWISASTHTGALGHKWHHRYDLALVQGTDFDVLRLEYGRLVLLPHLPVGEFFYHRAEKLTVMREATHRFVLHTAEKMRIVLETTPEDGSHFRLTSYGDFCGNALQFNYDTTGHLSQIRTPGEAAIHLTTDAKTGRISEIARTAGDLREVLVRYDYDGAGNLAAATDTTGVPFSYRYDNKLMVQETRRSGLSFYFDWDNISKGTAARVVRTWGDNNLYYRALAYDDGERATTVIDSHGHTRMYRANGRGLVQSERSPLGHDTHYAWTPHGELLSTTNPDGNIAESAYDSLGRQISFADFDGATTTYAYAHKHPVHVNFQSITCETDPLGHETQLGWDTSGNLSAVTDPLGNTVSFLRDQSGLPLALRDSEGTLARYSWSRDGHLIEERSAKGGRRRMTYDAFGRMQTEQREDEGALTLAYDSRDQVTAVTYPDGSVTRIGYDVEGNTTHFTDGAGRTTQWDFGALPFPVRRTNADGSVFAYGYDTELQLVALTNEVSETYQLAYDADGRLVGEIGFDGRHQTYEYSPAGFVVKATDGDRIHHYGRDALGQLVSRDSSDGTSARFAYDPAGRMTAAVNAVREVSFVYDARGSLIEEVQDGQSLAHSYDARGLRTGSILPDGRHLRMGYDQDGFFNELGYEGRSILQIGRDQIGRERSRSAVGSIETRIEYDPQGRILSQTARKGGAGSPIFARHYGYDAAGLITSIKDQARGTHRYDYDNREQLRSVTGDMSEAFSFDPAGNILSQNVNPTDASVVGGRVLMQGDAHFTYDDAGNRVRMERGWGGVHRVNYAYDAQNQLIEVTEEGPGVLRHTRFAYDALGRRVMKAHRAEKRNAQAANAVIDTAEKAAARLIRDDVTWFLWNGDVLLSEGVGDADGPVDALAVVYAFEPSSFRPAAQIRRVNPEAKAQAYLYWLDHLGTPQEITNEKGELVWQVALKAWGGIGRIIVEQIGNTLRFQGQYHDTETDLHYNRFRHYDPAAGAFINQDPIGLLGGEVTASYAPNPLVWLDPFGLNRWHDWLRAHPGQTTSQASPGYRAAHPPPPTTGAVHGNSHASTRPTVGYVIKERGTGRVLKFGETSNPNPQRRYTQNWYRQNNAYMDEVKIGSKRDMHRWQSDRIRQYERRHGVRPPLNKCYY